MKKFRSKHDYDITANGSKAMVAAVARDATSSLAWAFTLCALVIVSIPVQASDNPEHELGNWFIWNGTIRVGDRWSVFTEAQLRLWEVTSN